MAVVIAATLGAAFASFLNVVILRRREERSWVGPPSSCPQCDRRLRPYELVPVFSWLALRGRCRGCGVPIAPRYLAVEAAGAFVFGVTAAFFIFVAAH